MTLRMVLDIFRVELLVNGDHLLQGKSHGSGQLHSRHRMIGVSKRSLEKILSSAKYLDTNGEPGYLFVFLGKVWRTVPWRPDQSLVRHLLEIAS